MAVVFISPKQRQKAFLRGIIIFLLIFFAFTASLVFLSKPKKVSPLLVFQKPKVTIDLGMLDSPKFKNLDPFPKIENQFIYEALKGKETIKGLVSAPSLQDAEKILKELGLEIVSLKQATAGRENPFVPYSLGKEKESSSTKQSSGSASSKESSSTKTPSSKK